MTYLIIAAAIFAVNAALTFATRVVSNLQFLITIAVFPLVWLGTGQTLAGLGTQVASGIVFFGLGALAFFKLGFGGGVSRAMIMAALWTPVSGALLNLLWITPIVGVGLGALIAKIERTKDIAHYAALIFVCCSGILVYEHKNAEPLKPNNMVAEQSNLTLRGASTP